MMRGSATTLFVSSTCYDLAQVRADIRDFADSCGFDPILSEFHSFPVNPSQDTVQNCLDVVRNRADLFVLIIGNRYGSINETGKSVTNLEYAEAAARGIPRYVFVKQDILALLPVWRANPAADFSVAVDTPKLFEFVASLRDGGDVWVFPFGIAQDITRVLRTQLSYLFADSLGLRARLKAIDTATLALGPDALRLYIEKPSGWEHLVLAKILQDRIEAVHQRRLDLELGIAFGPIIDLPTPADITKWVLIKLDRILQITTGVSNAMNGGIEKAVGPPGKPGDIKRIEHIASRIAEGYLEAIEWTLEFKRTNAEPAAERLLSLASELSSNMLSEIEEYARNLFDQISRALRDGKQGETVTFTLTLTVPDIAPLTGEMKRLEKVWS